jgi:hypothetical protein
MPKDINMDGVYFTPLVACYLAAFVVFLACRWVIVRVHLERAFWRPELAETGLFLIILAAVARLS